MSKFQETCTTDTQCHEFSEYKKVMDNVIMGEYLNGTMTKTTHGEKYVFRFCPFCGEWIEPDWWKWRCE
jgi:hypothetical protein